MVADLLSNNLFVYANHIHKGEHHLGVIKTKEGLLALKVNNLFEQLRSRWLGLDRARAQLSGVIQETGKSIGTLSREAFVDDSGELTPLVSALQKFNQTPGVQPISQNPVCPFDYTPMKAKVEPSMESLDQDTPEFVREYRLGRRYMVRRYPGDRIDHSKEAVRIFFRTQRERFLSLVGRIVEAVARFFGKVVTFFRSTHYRQRGETDADIYAPSNVSPLPLSQGGGPTSYWLGHASLFLTLPLENGEGVNVLIDPVEGDLNKLFYPRETRIPCPIARLPAPHVYLLSHNHLDHYSEATVKQLFAQQPVMIVPEGDGARFKALAKKLGFTGEKIHEIEWWHTKRIEFERNGQRVLLPITAIPANHWCGQGPGGGHESSFVGYLFSGMAGGGDLYFAGDTARLNEAHITKLRERYNIRWSFQPGGPDEVRSDMESTHQASVDGVWMHFKVMLQKIYQPGMVKGEFLRRASQLRTVYMHTMTYKLGNLHLSDTVESLERLFLALETGKESLLREYEQVVYQDLERFFAQLEFARGENLDPQERVALLRETVVVPKIGSRIDLSAPIRPEDRFPLHS